MKPIFIQDDVPEHLFIGEWRVDGAANRIAQGETQVKLESRMMHVLLFLADRPGDVVPREMLEREVWGGRVVSYDALTVCLKKLRKCLGDDPRAPRYIETIAKKGYRLVAPVRRVAAPRPMLAIESVRRNTWRSAQPPSEVALSTHVESNDIPIVAPSSMIRKPIRHGYVLGGFALIIILASTMLLMLHQTTTDPRAATDSETPSLAVLPFKNLNAETAKDYLSDGLTADITTALSHHAGLFVIAHTSTLEFTTADSTRAGVALGVRYILQGSLQRTATRLRVNAQLIDERTGIQLWAERYDRTMADILTVQDDIVGQIERALALTISATEKQRAARPYTMSVEAYDTFLRGQTLFSHRTAEDNAQARALFKTAIELDPAFARAYSALALTYTHDKRFGWNASEKGASLTNAETYAKKALELDTDLPQAHWVMGHVYALQQAYPLAQRHARLAVDLNPNFADGYMALANAMIYSGQSADALPFIHKAMRLNPRYPAQYAEILGQAYYLSGRNADAVTALRSAVERNANLLPSYIFLAAALVGLGDTDEATWILDQAHILMPNLRAKDVLNMFPLMSNQAQGLLENLRHAGMH